MRAAVSSGRSLTLISLFSKLASPSGAGAVMPDRLSWARSYLKSAGLLASGGRGIWLLTDEGRAAKDWPIHQLRKVISQAIREQNDARREAGLSSDTAPALSIVN